MVLHTDSKIKGLKDVNKGFLVNAFLKCVCVDVSGYYCYLITPSFQIRIVSSFILFFSIINVAASVAKFPK